MAHAYSKLYKIPTTGVRFFTVYGPWGRPDMAPYLFMNSILKGETIKVFNHGKMKRDFTFVNDIVAGVLKVVNRAPETEIPFNVYNIGNSEPVDLMQFISEIEEVSGKKATLQMTDMQLGDVVCTYADTSRLQNDFGYKPSTSIKEGIRLFYDWFKMYVKE